MRSSDIGPLSVNPKVPFDRTVRSPLCSRSRFESSREPKLLRVISGTEVPSMRAIPLAPRRGRSPAGNPEAAAQRVRSRSSVYTGRAFRSSETRRSRRLGPPRRRRPGPKAALLPACSPFPSRRHPKTPPDGVGVSVPAGIRRHRRFETRLARRLGPKASSVYQPALSSPGPKPRRFLSGAEAPSNRAPPFAPFEVGSLRSARSLRGPKPSQFPRFPSGTVNPSVPRHRFGDRSPFRSCAALSSRSLIQTERAVEMAPRASSPSGV
jgi:hypothetical protein